LSYAPYFIFIGGLNMGFPVLTGPTTADATVGGLTVSLTPQQNKIKIVNNDTANSVKVTVGTWADIWIHAGQTFESLAEYKAFTAYGIGATVSITYTCSELGTDVITRDEVVTNGIKGLVAVADAAATLTAAQLIAQSVFTQTPSAARTLTTGTGAEIIAAFPSYSVGSCIEFTIVNLAAAQVITLAAGASGVTLVGVATVQPVTSATFLIRVVSGTAVVIYRK
jgi:hypothetical protein